MIDGSTDQLLIHCSARAFQEMLSWSAQYFDYLDELATNVSKPHFRIPVFNPSSTAGARAVVVDMPEPALLRTFSTLEVEHRMTCADSPRMDESCPAWDHNIALGVVCAATPQEARTSAERVMCGERCVRCTAYPPQGKHGWLSLTAMSRTTSLPRHGALLRPGPLRHSVAGKLLFV